MRELIGYQVKDVLGNVVNNLDASLVLTQRTAERYWFGDKAPITPDGRRSYEVYSGDIEKPVLEAQLIEGAVVSEKDVEKFIEFTGKDKHNQTISKKAVLKELKRSTVHPEYDIAHVFDGKRTIVLMASEISPVH